MPGKEGWKGARDGGIVDGGDREAGVGGRAVVSSQTKKKIEGDLDGMPTPDGGDICGGEK